MIRRNQKSTIKGHLIHSMSVQHGRVQRQLYDTEKALYRFQYTEGRAMAPAQRQHSIGKAFGGLVLLSVAGIISTYGRQPNPVRPNLATACTQVRNGDRHPAPFAMARRFLIAL